MDDGELKLVIREAGNTWNPSLNVLRQKGYKLWITPEEDETIDFTEWCAEKDGRQFSATDPNILLGLVAMQEWRGDDWQKKEFDTNIRDELFSEAYPDDE